ncbi:hypothetical protein, partial [Frankia sp. Cj3]|uniref:hypothetical protein n=1 Tax=Frankia sp. Cj3 TaxID=2880976 RepID=UPI001EF6ED18
GELLPWNKIEEQLKPGLGTDWSRVAPVLQHSFSSPVVKAQLSSVLRGDTWTVPVNYSGWTGTITLDAKLTDFVHDTDVAKFEFETGSESQAGSASSVDGRWRLIAGLPIRVKTSKADYTVTPGGFWDWQSGMADASAGRSIKKSKTVEPASIFTAQANIGITI